MPHMHWVARHLLEIHPFFFSTVWCGDIRTSMGRPREVTLSVLYGVCVCVFESLVGLYVCSPRSSTMIFSLWHDSCHFVLSAVSFHSQRGQEGEREGGRERGREGVREGGIGREIVCVCVCLQVNLCVHKGTMSAQDPRGELQKPSEAEQGPCRM
jgi:hypothetical protein